MNTPIKYGEVGMMHQLLNEDGLELIDGADMLDLRTQAGGGSAMTKYRIDVGFVVEIMDGLNTEYFFFDVEDEFDCSLDEVIRARASHMNEEDKEIELYRWGVEKPEEADSESFGVYRVLLKTANGALLWLKEGNGAVIYNSMAKAREACEIQSKNGYQPIVV